MVSPKIDSDPFITYILNKARYFQEHRLLWSACREVMVGGGDGGGGVYFLFSATDYPLLDMTVKLKLSNINHSTGFNIICNIRIT